MADRVRHEHTHFSTENGHHLVTVTWYDLEIGDKALMPIFHETDITPDEAMDFAMALMTRATEAMRRQTKDALYGECKRCGNLRLIDVKRRGRATTERIHCPDCTDEGRPKRAIPTLEIRAVEERQKLDDHLTPKKI